MKRHGGADSDRDTVDCANNRLLVVPGDCRKMTEFRGRAMSSFAIAACKKSPMSLPAVNTPERPNFI
jgi:hypothetical protein